MSFKAGQAIECIERHTWHADELTPGKRYIVIDIERRNVADYIKIEGDDGKPHFFHDAQFRAG